MNKKTEQAIDILNNGGIIIFPTDTAYGIGCRIDRKDAIDRLIEIRKREEGKAMPILVESIEMVDNYLEPISEECRKLMEEYWPGGLTIVAKAIKEKIPDSIRAGKDTVGVRMPDNEMILKIINTINVPIIGSSANFPGEPTPYSIEDINKELIDKVDYVLDGSCKTCKPSTVIDCTQNPWRILREGAVRLNI